MNERRLIYGWHKYVHSTTNCSEYQTDLLERNRLITDMHREGIKPIAVFDSTGYRAWKRQTQEKREDARSLVLARSLLEDKRQSRLTRLNKILDDCEDIVRSRMVSPVVTIETENVQEVIKSSKLTESTATDNDETPVDKEEIQVDKTETQMDKEETQVDRDEVQEDNVSETKTTGPTEPIGMDIPGYEKVLQADRPTESTPSQTTEEPEPTAEEKLQTNADAAIKLRQAAQQLKEECERISRPSEATSRSTYAEDVKGSSSIMDGSFELPKGLEADSVGEELQQLVESTIEPAAEARETAAQNLLSQKEENLLEAVIETINSSSSTPSHVQVHQETFREIQIEATNTAKRYDKVSCRPTSRDYEEIRALLKVMGVPIIFAEAPHEAERLCAAMVQTGMADFAGTEDTDVLACGVPLLKNITKSSSPLEVVDAKAFQAELGLSDTQYLDFMVLNGTDATERIKGIGFVKALKLIKEHDNIENILEDGVYSSVKKTKISEIVKEDYMDRVNESRRQFTELPPLPHPEELQGEAAHPEVVYEYLETTYRIPRPAMPRGWEDGDINEEELAIMMEHVRI